MNVLRRTPLLLSAIVLLLATAASAAQAASITGFITRYVTGYGGTSADGTPVIACWISLNPVGTSNTSRTYYSASPGTFKATYSANNAAIVQITKSQCDFAYFNYRMGMSVTIWTAGNTDRGPYDAPNAPTYPMQTIEDGPN